MSDVGRDDSTPASKAASFQTALRSAQGPVGIALAVVISAAAFSAGIQGKRPSLTSLAVWSGGMLLMGIGAVSALRPLSPSRVAWPAGAAFVLVFANWSILESALRTRTTAFGSVALGFLVAVAVALVSVVVLRGSEARTAALAALGVAAALGVYTLATVPDDSVSLDRSTVEIPGELVGAPDIVLVIADGYARADVLKDTYGYDNSDFLSELSSFGFEVNPEAVAEYSMTYASLASTLNMAHVIEPGAPLGSSQRRALYGALAGDNAVVQALRGVGYRYVHLESGWGGTRCGPMVDDCVRSTWEETGWALVQRTPIGPIATRLFGSAFSQAALDRLNELDRIIRETSETPRLIVAHILMPHAPLHIRSTCAVDVRVEMGALNVAAPWLPGASLEERKQAYVEQIECFNDRFLDIARNASDDTVIVLMSDHGPDSLGQLTRPTASWTTDDMDERFGTLSALRLPSRCGGEEDAYGVDVFTVVLNCLFDTELPLHRDRRIIVNVEENFPDDPVREAGSVG